MQMGVAESDDQIIATAMLMGAEFVSATFLLRGSHVDQWRTRDQSGLYMTKRDAALKYLSMHGVDLNFDGVLVNLKE